MTRRLRPILFCCVTSLCVLFLGLSTARADPRTHDGFYMQFGAGLGYYHTGASAGGADITFDGLTIPVQLLLGGTLFKHLVLGGGFFLDTAPAPGYEINGQDATAGVDLKQFILGVGAFADYYVWSDRGLHFPVFFGWGGLETSADGNAGGSDPTGFITYFGGGYDFWISDSWCVGAVFRLVISPAKLNDVSYTTFEPGVLATITYH
jgi:hypothetical protein